MNPYENEKCEGCGFPAISSALELEEAQRLQSVDAFLTAKTKRADHWRRLPLWKKAGYIAAKVLPIIKEPITAPYFATMEKRLAAAAVDCLLIALATIMIHWLVSSFGIPDPGIWVLAVTTYVAYQAFALHFLGGTGIGRSLIGVCVLDARGRAGLTISQAIGRPFVRVLWLLGPGALAFRTQSEANEVLAVCATLPLVTDFLLLATHIRRQTIADLICRTVVFNTPPPQPHRAPAAPMYSATDAEFGVRPRKMNP